jgi:hypothetical protein
MVRIRLFLPVFLPFFFISLLIFALSGCEKEDAAAKEFGGVNSSCYSAKSEIYIEETASPKRRAASVAYRTVRFKDGSDEIYDFQSQVKDGEYIVLPDIRARYCKYEKIGFILTGWRDDSSPSIITRPGQKYKVTDSDITFKAKWELGNEIYSARDVMEEYNIQDQDNLSKRYKLMRNIDLRDYKAGDGWHPIGDESNPFTGELYGNNYTIDNLTINSDGSTAGLFGAIGGTSAIYDLRIALSTDGIKLRNFNQNKAAGALAGYVILDSPDDNVIIENVKTLSGKIQIEDPSCSTSPALYAGGIVGGIDVSADPTELNIINSSNSIDVSILSSLNSDCDAYLGGIIGSNFYIIPPKINISGTENHGAITSDIFRQVNIGGIAGAIYNDGTDSITVDNCTNYGEIKVASLSPSTGIDTVFAGGIAGETDVIINRSANHAVIRIENDQTITFPSSSIKTFAAGGIAGKLSVGGKVTRCTNDANVLIKNNAITSNTPNFIAGGIAGHLMGIISESSNLDLANITVSSENSNDDPRTYAGGVCGYSEGTSLLDRAIIDKSFNDGEVHVTVNENIYVSGIHADAGGLAGNASNYTDISDSYNTGDVSAQTFPGSVGTLKLTNAGGIAGVLGNDSTIERAYNNGNVSVDTGLLTPPPGSGVTAGGIAGYLGGTSGTVVNDSIQLNSDVTLVNLNVSMYRGWIAGRGESTSIISNCYSQRSPEGMHDTYGGDGTLIPAPDQAAYEAINFVFTGTWIFDEEEGRPVLQWEKE